MGRQLKSWAMGKRRAALTAVLVGAVSVGFGQSVGAHSMPDSEQVVREIDDPGTGTRWLLVRDRAHSGGPGRLVQVGGVLKRNRHAGPDLGQKLAVFLPVIRAGERLVVEEHSAVVDARLEAVALGPAAAGAALKVRLAIGGKVLQAVALGPGRAEFAPETGVRP